MRPRRDRAVLRRAGARRRTRSSMAIHVRDTDRLIGTCALSQLDSDNGSALYHITIGEKDAWGHGYGTEATAADDRPRVRRRSGCTGSRSSVFAFNERAIRSYQSVGFVDRGPGPRGDLARRPVVGRDLDERPRLRLGGAPAGRRGRRRRDRRAERSRRGPAYGRAEVRRRSPGSSGGADEQPGPGRRRGPGRRPRADRRQGPRRRQRPRGGRPAGRARSRRATCSGRRS